MSLYYTRRFSSSLPLCLTSAFPVFFFYFFSFSLYLPFSLFLFSSLYLSSSLILFFLPLNFFLFVLYLNAQLSATAVVINLRQNINHCSPDPLPPPPHPLPRSLMHLRRRGGESLCICNPRDIA